MPLVTHGDKQRAEAVNSEFGEQAMRVITITQKRFTDMPDELTPEFLEDGLELIGLVGIIDPPRPESRDAVERARQAGIKTVMITGDHVVTASAIAREIGILQDGDKALTGAELQQMSDDELDANVKSYAVYARVTPEDKIRIVKSWQRQNQVVAMTGDGVNDAPALKAANAGIAMGQTGTDVAREASDIILTDDNFATIVDAVEQGRGIYANIRKTINFLLSANISEILTIVIAIIVGWGSPVVAVHLLFINLVADGLPGFALSREPSHDNVMDEKPIKKGSSVFANGLAKRIAFNASGFAALTLFAYWFGQNVSVGGVTASHEVGQTMAFLGLSLASTWHVFNIRSERSLFSIPYSANRTLVNMVFLAVGITILVALVPFTQDLLYLTPISWIHWALSIGLSLLPVLVYEIVKFTWKKQGKVA
jgi:magnesium-transporting ATPase (P-type)